MEVRRPIPDWLDVSRETIEKLDAFLGLVTKWNSAINLVSGPSLKNGWERHILDSAQLSLLSEGRRGLWVDIGSGGGFPGLVLAIIFHGAGRDIQMRLVESDERKCAFLREASRRMQVPVEVCCERVEGMAPQGADILSARAFAPMDKILSIAKLHLRDGGVAILPKGKSFADEIAVAKRSWVFEVEERPSFIEPEAMVLIVGNIRHV